MTVIMTMILERGAFLKGKWLIKTMEMGERNGQTAWKQEMETRESEGGCDVPVTTSPLVLSNATDAAPLRERL
jgi:hypothetical protein